MAMMKVFCVRCGTPAEVDSSQASAFLTCAKCGTKFSAQAPAAPAKSSNAAAIVVVAVIAVPVVIAVIGILAAIAIPNFIRFQARSKQGECKTNLKGIFVAEKAYFADHDAYAPTLSELGFTPERGNRYAYYLGDGPLAAAGTAPSAQAGGFDVDLTRWPTAKSGGGRLPPELAGAVRPGVDGHCPACELTAACVGNVDNDPTADVWSISTRERVAPDGERIMPGMPYNDVNDIQN